MQSKKMLAAIYYDKENIQVKEVSAPVLQKNNMIARVLCCAICGTDLKLFMVGGPKIKAPRIIGHEFVAKIVEIGEEVSGFEIGEHIVLATTLPCGECAYCKEGYFNLCQNTKPISAYYDGGFAEFIEIPALAIEQGNVIKVPQSESYDAYTICEPLSCAINSHEIAGMSAGKTCVIVGGGPLGAIHAELAKAEGAKSVSIVEVSQNRLNLISELEDINLIDASNQNVTEVIYSLTDGLGADVVIVAAPAAVAMEDSLRYVKKGGVVSYFASLPLGKSTLQIDSRLIHYNELRVVGASDSRKEHVQKAVDYIYQGRINTEAIITHEVSLKDIHKGFELMQERLSLKVLVRC